MNFWNQPNLTNDTTEARLFQPLALGKLRLRNRVWLAGLPSGRADLEGNPTQEMRDFYNARTEAGMMITEPVIAGPGAARTPREPRLDPQCCSQGWMAFAQDLRQHGVPCAMQLWSSSPGSLRDGLRSWACEMSQASALALNLGFSVVECLLPQSWLRGGPELEALLPIMLASTGPKKLALRFNLQESLAATAPGLAIIDRLCRGQLAWLRVICSEAVVHPWNRDLTRWWQSLETPLVLPAPSCPQRTLLCDSQGIQADALTFGAAFMADPQLAQTLARQAQPRCLAA